jgi:hypothetical protein
MKNFKSYLIESKKDYLNGYCHVYALAIIKNNPKWKIRLAVSWDKDAEEDDDYVIEHVYVIDPKTNKAYDSRGEYQNEQELIDADGMFSVEDTYDYTLKMLNADVETGKLKKYTDKDVNDVKLNLNQVK